jgi:hypothetical protein
VPDIYFFFFLRPSDEVISDVNVFGQLVKAFLSATVPRNWTFVEKKYISGSGPPCFCVTSKKLRL